MSPELTRVETKVTHELHGLSARDTQSTQREHPEKWSIQQIVEHLLLGFRLTAAEMRQRLDQLHVKSGPRAAARPATSITSTLQRTLTRFAVLRFGYMPGGLETPAALRPSLPSTLRSGAELSNRLHVELSRLDQLALEAEHRCGSRPVFPHGVLGPLSVSQWRRFHLLHSLHHARQLRAIRAENDL